ncbi:transglycosylase SLT domain-containing protein [Paenilisteria rocourtiae]|uniref:Transglycosylase-like protein with SLT domain n=1 Tax=Listeria rocourtiae TaxID=647910 RepID=A0A4R6ZMD3_9LIST|nr:transglycosylase SLT domain-containing protein [Listeria rocourtiae]MBC1434323.1 transglycosylase SLT domain-containing protein [Listeria rocourtiae]MBC1604015.1 transglycosylase SLT domain-containing protein [Listeria rocourtiae]TDR53472.1 transglycosylase-like protein with SLT domain [Listeria rocourtiae]
MKRETFIFILGVLAACALVFHFYDQHQQRVAMMDMIKETAKKHDIPAWIPLSIAETESGFDPKTIGDAGTSYGLFQLHRGGLAPEEMTDDELLKPEENIEIAITNMTRAYDRAQVKGLEGIQMLTYIANTSGWPTQRGTDWTDQNTNYNKKLAKNFKKHVKVTELAVVE